MHAVQIEEARETIEASFGTVYKPSGKLLDTRRVFEQMVKQKKYTEAHELKAEIAKMEKTEQKKHMEMRSAKV